MSHRGQWLIDFGIPPSGATVDGLVPVRDYSPDGRPPEEVVIIEAARRYGADAVFFEAPRNDRPPVAQAFVFVDDGPTDDPSFAELHKRLWSWGAVPLVYRKTNGAIQLFRCAHKPDFVARDGSPVCKPVSVLRIASAISDDPWWDHQRLRNGTLWDDPKVSRTLLSSEKAAHKSLYLAVKALDDALAAKQILKKSLRRKLLILSLLIAYLEAREVFADGYFAKFVKGATKFFEVLRNGNALVALLADLENRFNGNVFILSEPDAESLKSSGELEQFASLIEGKTDERGQWTLWQLYSFEDLPVELISQIYQLFVKDSKSSVYTPPFLVRLMLNEALSWERLDRLQKSDEVILDPACGSGVFLVESYKRLVLHWRSRNHWKKPNRTTLRSLLQKLRGVDCEADAVELAAFSLCLALCDALEPAAIRESIKLFPPLAGTTIHHSCFFEAMELGRVNEPVGVVVGNPPFESRLTTPGAVRSYKRYQKSHGSLPDKQLAYLFLHDAMHILVDGGVLSMLQQYNFLYNQKSLAFRRRFVNRWDVRELLDFVSVRGLFTKGKRDTKVVAVIAEKKPPPAARQILHATFRRSGRADAEQGFDIDYYDLHWVPRSIALNNDGVWRSNLLGGGRTLDFADRLRQFPTLRKYAEERNWECGEGFIEGKSGQRQKAEHLTGEDLVPAKAIGAGTIDRHAIKTVKAKCFKTAYTRERFTPPMLLVREQKDLGYALWTDSYLTYMNKVVGFCAPQRDLKSLTKIYEWIGTNHAALKAFAAAISVRMFTQRSTTLSEIDVLSLPYREDGSLDLSPNEKVIVNDIVEHFSQIIQVGQRAPAVSRPADGALADFATIFTRQVSTVYKKNPLRPLEAHAWAGVICQAFVFGKGKVDWSGPDELHDRLCSILADRQSEALHVTRIARIYDGSFIFLLKPDRLRFWLRSVALRDADDVLADLRSQGF